MWERGVRVQVVFPNAEKSFRGENHLSLNIKNRENLIVIAKCSAKLGNCLIA